VDHIFESNIFHFVVYIHVQVLNILEKSITCP